MIRVHLNSKFVPLSDSFLTVMLEMDEVVSFAWVVGGGESNIHMHSIIHLFERSMVSATCNDDGDED